MSPVFADTNYWVALTDPKDQWNPKALAASRALARRPVVTTEEVLTEFLAFFAGRGTHVRQVAALTVRAILRDDDVEVVPQSHDSFLAGLDFYERRADKGYSLTDCVSMILMRERGLTDVLTNDAHFQQEGFAVLL